MHLRLLCLLMVLTLLPERTWAQINFKRSSWKDVLAEAKIQRRLIFVDIYTDWCGPCKKLDREVFSSKTVGNQFNNYFINYKADAEKGGLELARTYNVRAYPTGLFIDGDGRLVHSFIGYRPAQQFMHEGEQAFLRTPEGVNMALYANAYEEGDRSAPLVRALAKLRIRYGQDTRPMIDDYLAKLPADSLKQPINLVIAYENVTGIDRAFDVLLANKQDKLFYNRALVALSRAMNRLVAERNEAGLPDFLAAVDRLGGNETEALKADYKTQFYQGIKQWDRYAEQAHAYVKQHLAPSLSAEVRQQQPDAYEAAYSKLCEIGHTFARDIRDEARLKAMADYVRQANEQRETYIATGVCACLLYQLGQKAEAVQWQEKALALAEQAGATVDTDTYKTTLKRMQKGKPL